ncbi:chaperone [Lithospermum erythrorhizon]|uniref:Chaperone n=1 Tax=Lithospermum erythrorhizon TaxID=34254 RepID=A0AAV3NSM1_LITER
MDVTKGSAAATHIYEDFVPTSELVLGEDCDTLLIHLPGFKKEQLRVQLTTGMLRISGSMPMGDNKMRRFQKEFPVSPNCETNQITARFDSGILHVKQPKLITPATSATPEQQKLPPPQQQPATTPSPAAQESKKPVNEPRETENAVKKANGTEEGKKMFSEEEMNMGKVTRNEEKTETKNDGEMKDEVTTGTDNYRKMLGKRLKMQRRVLHIFLAALFTCMVAIYVKKLIITFRQPKN